MYGPTAVIFAGSRARFAAFLVLRRSHVLPNIDPRRAAYGALCESSFRRRHASAVCRARRPRASAERTGFAANGSICDQSPGATPIVRCRVLALIRLRRRSGSRGLPLHEELNVVEDVQRPYASRTQGEE